MAVNKARLFLSGPMRWHDMNGKVIHPAAYGIQSSDGTETWDVCGPFDTREAARAVLEELLELRVQSAAETLASGSAEAIR